MTDWPGDPPDFVANKRVTAGGAYPDTNPYALNPNIVDCLKALYDLLTGDSLFAVDAKLKMDAGLSVEFWLGDAAGTEKLIVRDSGGVEVAAIDSNGNITLSGTVDGVDLAAHVLDADAHHVSFVAADHTAIGDGAPHHAAATAIDGQHTIAGQVISGVDAAAAQKGHIQLTGHLGGTAALPDVRGLRETAGPTLLTLGAILDGEYLVRSGNTVIGGAAGGYEPLITGGVDPAVFILADFDLIMVAMV